MKTKMEVRHVSDSGVIVEILNRKERGGETIFLGIENGKNPRPRFEIRKNNEKAEIHELQKATSVIFKKYAQAMLLLALDKLKKDHVQEVEIIDPDISREAALKIGFTERKDGLKLTNLQAKTFKVGRKNEKTIARYSLNGTTYELKESKKKIDVHPKEENTVRLADEITGLTASIAKWQAEKDRGYIYDVKTSGENARMAKTTILYALWQMKKQGVKDVSLTYCPEEGKRKKARGLYASVGFRPTKKEGTLEIDLEKTRIQKMYLK